MRKRHSARPSARFCSACGTESTVYDSRPAAQGIVRHRRCNACNAKWKTIEMREEKADAPRDRITKDPGNDR